MSLPNTVLNTIVAESVERLAGELQSAIEGGKPLEDALPELVRESWLANKQVVFNGDNYSEEWHAEAEQRGLKNLRTTPDALPELVSESTVGVFGNSTCCRSASWRRASRCSASSTERW